MACPKALVLNTSLLPVKMTYFFCLAAVASLLPYMAIYMKQLGLSASETAIIYGLMPFLGAIFRFLIGMLADKSKKHKTILMLCCILTGVSHAFLLYNPEGGATPHPHLQKLDVRVLLQCDPSHQGLIQYCVLDSETECLVKNQNQTGNVTDCSQLSASAVGSALLENRTHCDVKCKLPPSTPPSGLCFTGSNADTPYTCLPPERVPKANQTDEAASYSLSFTVNSGLSPHIHYEKYGTNNLRTKECTGYSMQSITYLNMTKMEIQCDTSFNASCQLHCLQQGFRREKDTCGRYRYSQEDNPRWGATFWYFFIFFLIGQMAFSPIFSLIDAMVYAYLGAEGGQWGQQRLWGTVGFAAFALLSSYSMVIFRGYSGGQAFFFAFMSYAVFQVISAVVVCFYKIGDDVKCTNLLKNVGALCRQFEVLLLFFHVTVFGIFTGVIETFLYWHLENICAQRVLFGLCIVMNGIPEVIILFLAGSIIKKVGHFGCLCLVYLAYGIRLCVYALISNPWYVLFVEPLHGVCFGLMYATASGYGNDITAAGFHGTVQSIIGGLHFGAGKGAGSMLGGLIFQYFGAIAMFSGFGVSSFVLMLVYIVVYLTCVRGKQRRSPIHKPADTPTDDEKDVRVEMVDNKATNGRSGKMKNLKQREAAALMAEHKS